jgi:hypothetical protein
MIDIKVTIDIDDKSGTIHRHCPAPAHTDGL